VWAVSVVAASCVVVSVSVDRRCRCCCAAACRLHPLDQAFVFHCVKCVFVETDLSVPETSIRDSTSWPYTAYSTPEAERSRSPMHRIAGSRPANVRLAYVSHGAGRGCRLTAATEVPGSAAPRPRSPGGVAYSPSVGRPRNRTYRAVPRTTGLSFKAERLRRLSIS